MKTSINQTKLIVSSIFLPLALVACGGGGSDGNDSTETPSVIVDKYIGDWVSTCSHDSETGLYYKSTETITKISSTSFKTTGTIYTYNNSSCSGSPSDSYSAVLTAKITGQTAIDGISVEQVIVTDTSDNSSWKDLAIIKDGKFYTGLTTDSNYPTAIDYSTWSTKEDGSGGFTPTTPEVLVNTTITLAEFNYISYTLDTGIYKVEVSSSNNGVTLNWSGSSNCSYNPENTLHNATCTMNQLGQLVVTNPSTWGLGGSEVVAIKITKNPQL